MRLAEKLDWKGLKKYKDQMNIPAFVAVSFITFFHILLVLFYIIVRMAVCFIYF
jgi:hypothetical protein